MLSRFRNAQRLELDGPEKRRPYIAAECDNLKDANRWRSQLIGEIAKLVAEIQNAGLGEFRIRDMNDEINKKVGGSLRGHCGVPHHRPLGHRPILSPPPAPPTHTSTRADPLSL